MSALAKQALQRERELEKLAQVQRSLARGRPRGGARKRGRGK
jgi:hypothetical protein